MAQFLPVEWEGKRALVRLNRPDSGSFEATIEGQNEGGFFVSRAEDEQHAFIPWGAISWVQLLEEPDPDEREFLMGRPDE